MQLWLAFVLACLGIILLLVGCTRLHRVKHHSDTAQPRAAFATAEEECIQNST